MCLICVIQLSFIVYMSMECSVFLGSSVVDVNMVLIMEVGIMLRRCRSLCTKEDLPNPNIGHYADANAGVTFFGCKK